MVAAYLGLNKEEEKPKLADNSFDDVMSELMNEGLFNG